MRGAALAAALVIAALVGAGAGYFVGASNEANNASQSVPYTTIIAHVLRGGNITDISEVPLTVVASSQTGYSSSQSTNPGGVTQVTKDTGHLQIVLRDATFPNGSMAIVLTLTNIGRLNVSVGSSVLGGAENSGVGNNASSAERFDSYLVGCVNNSTVLSPVVYANNVTTVTSTEPHTVVCSQVAAQRSPILLSPGESFSGFVLVSHGVLAGLNVAGAGAGYSVVNTGNQGYWISARFATS